MKAVRRVRSKVLATKWSYSYSTSEIPEGTIVKLKLPLGGAGEAYRLFYCNGGFGLKPAEKSMSIGGGKIFGILAHGEENYIRRLDVERFATAEEINSHPLFGRSDFAAKSKWRKS